MTVTNERLIELHYMLESVTDEELLLAARHRGLFRRVEASHVIAGWQINSGSYPPPEYVQARLGRMIGEKIGEVHWSEIPGARIERGSFLNTVYHTQDMKFTLPVNFVVEKK